MCWSLNTFCDFIFTYTVTCRTPYIGTKPVCDLLSANKLFLEFHEIHCGGSSRKFWSNRDFSESCSVTFALQLRRHVTLFCTLCAPWPTCWNSVYECPPNCDFRENRRRLSNAFVASVGEVNLETECTSQVKNALINCVCLVVLDVAFRRSFHRQQGAEHRVWCTFWNFGRRSALQPADPWAAAKCFCYVRGCLFITARCIIPF